jgi:hypothetical protein
MGDGEASPRTNYEKTTPLQSLKRFPDGSSADAETLRYLLLTYALAARKAPVPDCITQTLIDKIRPRAIMLNISV